MVDQIQGRTHRDDSLVPIITGLVVLAAAGPALYTAATSWLLPRLNAGGAAASLSLAEWWAANDWLVAFWAVELVLLLAFLAWSRRRDRRRRRQLDSVAVSLARILPSDWEPARHLRVLRWRGHQPIRVRVELTPRSPITDRAWRASLTDAARTALGPVAPISWPTPPRGGVFDWGRRPPRIELRAAPVTAAVPVRADYVDRLDDRTEVRLVSTTGSASDSRTPPSEDLPIYRRPVSAGRSVAPLGSRPTHPGRED